jgi:hypothetical protein
VGFQFVPITLNGSELPVFVGNRIYLDFRNYPDGPYSGELLRLLHALVGEPRSRDAARFATAQDKAANKINGAIKKGNAQRLRELFGQGGLSWQISAAPGCNAAEGLTKSGHNDEAIDMLSQLEIQYPRAIRPRQLRALGLARCAARTGNTENLEAVQDTLGELEAAGERDPETLGTYART